MHPRVKTSGQAHQSMDSRGGVNYGRFPLVGQDCSPSSQNHQTRSAPPLTFTEVPLSQPHTQATLQSSIFQTHEHHNARSNLSVQAPRALSGSDAMRLHQMFSLGVGSYNRQFHSQLTEGVQDPKNLLNDSCSGNPQVGETSSQAFMNALALLRQNIEHLQTLVQLVAQGGNFSIAAIRQQMKAAAGMATVISQLIAVTDGLLPQSHQQSTQSAFFFPASHSAAESIQGVDVFQHNSSEGSLTATMEVFDGHCTLGEERHNSIDIASYVGESGLDASIQLTAEHFLSTNQSNIPASGSLRTSVADVERASGLNGTRPRFSGKISPRSGLEVSNDTCAMFHESLDTKGSSEDQDPAYALQDEEDEDEAEHLPLGSYELVEMDAMEILAEHTHFCEICGKGFKRDANLRMHMRGHGDEYKTAAALAKPDKVSQDPSLRRPRRYSCPYPGCKRNKKHKKFLPLKTMLCVKNHYRRSHCPKILTCSKCKVKTFSVVADLKTHEKHCGQEKWQCSCGTTFSRKDKLMGHVALFIGHAPATRLFDTESSGIGDKAKNEMGLCNTNLSTVSGPKRSAKIAASAGGFSAVNGSRFKWGENLGVGSETKPEIIPATTFAVVNNSGTGAKVGVSNSVWKDAKRQDCGLNSSDSESSIAISESQVSAFSSIGHVGDVSLLTAASDLHGFFGINFVHSPNVTNQSAN